MNKHSSKSEVKMNSDKVQYNPQLDDAAQCILEDDRELTALAVSEALEASCDGAVIWLFKAWCGQTLAEVEESLQRAAALEPENQIATSGLAWIKGLNELATGHFEAKQRAEEEAEASRKAEEEAEAKRKADADRKAREEAEAKRKLEEEAQLKAEKEAESKRRAEEEQLAEAQADEQAGTPSEDCRETGNEAEQSEPADQLEASNDDRLDEFEKQMDALPPVVAGNMGVATRVEKLRPAQAEEEILAEVESLKDEVQEELSGPDKAELKQQEQKENEPQAVVEQEEPAAVEENSEEKAKSPASNATADEHKPVVLAVDDSPTIRKLVSLTLTGAGYEVITASDGVEALTMLNDRIPDIVLSDINMPKLNGYKLCKFIKKHEAWKSIPVVMLSGKDGLFDKMRGKMNGCDDFISKPFESEDLIAKVREHLAAIPAG